jgi:hypothetical protein
LPPPSIWDPAARTFAFPFGVRQVFGAKDACRDKCSVLCGDGSCKLTRSAAAILAWRRDCNANHPHSSLGNLSPEEYARQAKNITQTAAISGEVVA